MKVGDLVKTVGSAYGTGGIGYCGIVIDMETQTPTNHAHVYLTKATTLGDRTHWFPIQKLEVINAGR